VEAMRDLDGPESWSVMNLLFPLQVSRSESDTTIGYLARTRWVLPRVPVLGEEVEAIGHRVKVVRVLWNRDGNVTVGLAQARVGPDALDTLEREGWSVQPSQGEPPPGWLEERPEE
jgi:hypothetical protein